MPAIATLVPPANRGHSVGRGPCVCRRKGDAPGSGNGALSVAAYAPMGVRCAAPESIHPPRRRRVSPTPGSLRPRSRATPLVRSLCLSRKTIRPPPPACQGGGLVVCQALGSALYQLQGRQRGTAISLLIHRQLRGRVAGGDAAVRLRKSTRERLADLERSIDYLHGRVACMESVVQILCNTEPALRKREGHYQGEMWDSLMGVLARRLEAISENPEIYNRSPDNVGDMQVGYLEAIEDLQYYCTDYPGRAESLCSVASGESCSAGVYRSQCDHQVEITLHESDVIPSCKQCYYDVNWTRIKSLDASR